MKNRLNKSWSLFLYLIPYALIYSIPLSNGLIIVLLLITLVILMIEKKGVLKWSDFFLLSAPFWVTFIGLFYTPNLKVGLSLLETRLPLFLFPFIFFIKSPSHSELVRFLRHFVYSIFVTFFILLILAVYRNFLDPGSDVWINKWYYHYDNLTEPIDIQPLYLSLYVSIALLLVLMDKLDPGKFGIIKNHRLRWSLLPIFSVFLVMLGVRSILIITVFLIGLTFIRNKYFLQKRSLSIAGAIVVGLIGLSILSPVTSGRFEGLFNVQYNFSKYSVDRFIIWSLAFSHVSHHPLQFVFGEGTGSSEKIMDGIYKAEGIDWDFEKKTNTHNQFLEFTLDTGYFGTAALVLYLVILFARFYSSQNRIGELFVVLMSLAMISENYLNRQKGVVFFSLFLSLLAFEKDSEPRESGTKLIQTKL